MAVREEAMLEVKEKLEGVKESRCQDFTPQWAGEWKHCNGELGGGDDLGGREKRSSNVHQVVGNAEVKLVRVFRIGEREKKDLEGFRL